MAGEVCLVCQNKGEGYVVPSVQYKCTICGAAVTWRDAVAHYMKHMKISGNDAVCGVCNAKVKRAEIRKHLRGHFAVGEGGRYFCGVCGREFVDRESLLVHIMRSHE